MDQNGDLNLDDMRNPSDRSLSDEEFQGSHASNSPRKGMQPDLFQNNDTDKKFIVQVQQERFARKQKKKRDLQRIRNSPQDQDEIAEVRSKSSQDKDGVFCSILFTVCFFMHFLLEFGGGYYGSHYSMQNVLSDYFENRVINLAEINQTQELNFTGLYLKDVHTIQELQTFASFLIDTLYPLKRDVINLEIRPNVTKLNDDGTSTSTNFDQILVNATYFNTFNYYCGMQINVRESKLIENTQQQSKRVITHLKPVDYDELSDSSLSLFNKLMNYLKLETTSKGSSQKQTYTEYFGGDQNREEVTRTFRDLINEGWFNTSKEQPMVQTDFKIAFYNQNDELGMIISYNFFMSNSGALSQRKSVHVFKPQNYSPQILDDGSIMTSSSNSNTKTLSMIVWMFQTAVLTLYSLIDIIYKLRLFLFKRQFQLDWFAYIEYAILVLCMIIIWIWNVLFGLGNDIKEFNLPMSEEDFNTYVFHSELTDKYAMLTGVIALLLITKNLKALTSKFPSFGLLFETINEARMDLLYFSIMTMSVAVSCTVVTYCLFGPNSKAFSTMSNAAYSILKLAFGFDMFPDMDKSNPDISKLFFVLFAIIFNFVILPVYAAIVMRTYDNLRLKKQLLSEAMADILTKEAELHSQRFWNFLFCKMDKVGEDELETDSSDDDLAIEESNLTYEEYKRRIRIGKEYEKEQKRKQLNAFQNASWGHRISHNLETLKMYMNPEAYEMSTPEFEKKLRNSKVKVLKENWTKREIRLRKFGELANTESFIKVRNIIVYVIFLSMFMTMADKQIQTQDSADQMMLASLQLKESLQYFPKHKYIEGSELIQFNMQQKQFAKFDINKDGQIEQNEALTVLSQTELQTDLLELNQKFSLWFQDADKNNDNMIDFNEFKESSNLKNMIDDFIYNQLKHCNWKDIHTVTDIQQYLMGPLFNFLFEKQNKYDANFIIGSQGKKRGWLGKNDFEIINVDELARLFIVLKAEKLNNKVGTKGVFPNTNVLWKTSQELNSVMHFSSFNTKEDQTYFIRQDSFIEPKTLLNFDFFENVNNKVDLTYKGKSGYVWSISNDEQKAKKLLDDISAIDFGQKGMHIGELIVEFVIYNANYQIYQTVRISFDVDGTGNVNKNLDITKAELQHFQKSQPGTVWREFVFILFFLFEAYKICCIIKTEWAFMSSLEAEVKISPELSCLQRFAIRLGCSPAIVLYQSQVIIFVQIIKCSVLKVIEMLMKFVKIIKNTFGTDLFKLLDLISTVMFFIQIVVWIQIIQLGKIEMDETTQTPTNIIQVCSGVSSKMITYMNITVISIVLAFIRILQYFTFSKKLSSFQEILISASFDLMFFFLLWMVLLIGFSFAFFAVFSQEVFELSTVIRSYITVFFMSNNNLDENMFESMSETNSTYIFAFYTVFLILYRILLFNMFVAIICAHYFQFQREVEEDQKGHKQVNTFMLIISIIRNKLREEQKEDDQEEAKKEEKEKDSKIKKGSKNKKKKAQVTMQFLIKKVKKLIITYINKLDSQLLGAEPVQDEDDEKEKQKEMMRQRRAIQKKYDQPDILEYKTDNYGLKPYMLHIKALKQGEQALEEYKEKLQDNKEIKLQVEDLVSSNTWLEVLEEKIQKMSRRTLSLYDFQNYDRIYSEFKDFYNSSRLTMLQKKLLKIIGDDKRKEFILKSMRTYEVHNHSEAESQGKQSTKTVQENICYTSNIEFIYLVWKALDFEQLIDCMTVNATETEDKDSILELIEFLNQVNTKGTELDDEKVIEITDNLKLEFQKLSQSKFFTSEQLNKVTKLQQFLWTNVFDHNERYQLWFVLFNTIERVRLWNTLVFSEGYFKRAVFSLSNLRQDLTEYYVVNIGNKIDRDEKNALKEQYEQVNNLNAKLTLDDETKRKIRDKYFTTDVMLELWNLMKNRKYVIKDEAPKEQTMLQRIQTLRENQIKVEQLQNIMPKHEHIIMIRKLFKSMLQGVSKERMILLMDDETKKKIASKLNYVCKNQAIDDDIEYQIYLQFVTETYDNGEYRLPLWLPLSLEQKLDMMLHQRITSEVEIMQFLIDEEQGCGLKQHAPSLKKYEEVDKKLEQALDGLIFEKYLTLTRMQAVNSSIKRCRDRLNDNEDSDAMQLKMYTKWLLSKQEVARKYEKTVRDEISHLEKNNAHKLSLIAQQMRQPVGVQNKQQQN